MQEWPDSWWIETVDGQHLYSFLIFINVQAVPAALAVSTYLHERMSSKFEIQS